MAGFFNNQIPSVADAFNMKRDEIRDFFSNMGGLNDQGQKNAVMYGIPPYAHGHIDEVVARIVVLSTDYSPRLINKLLLPFHIDGRSFNSFPMYTIFDLMGWVFSIANSPPSLTDRRFYCPLAVIYARFCQILVPQGIGTKPQAQSASNPESSHAIALAYVVKVSGLQDKPGNRNNKSHSQPAPTASKKHREFLCVLLGSSLGDPRPGSSLGESSPRKMDMQEERRLAMVRTGLIEHDELMRPSTHNTPSTSSDSGIPPPQFGHCAETWWFCVVNQYQDLPQTTPAFKLEFGGLALSVPAEDTESNTLSPYDNNAWKDLYKPPCSNCKYIITEKLCSSIKDADRTWNNFYY